MDEPPIPMELTVCTGIVSCKGGSGPLYGNVSAFALLRKLKTSISKIARPSPQPTAAAVSATRQDRKSTRLNSSHGYISYAVFCLKKKKKKKTKTRHIQGKN